MAIDSDVSFDYVNKIVSRSGSPSSTVYSANALYSYIMDVFDELAQMNDQVPMSAATPTSYTMINGWYIQEALTQFLNGGAVQTSGYADEIRTLICGATGWTNFIAGDVGDLLTGGTTGDTGKVLDYDNSAYKVWVRMTDSGDLFDNATEAYTIPGTGAGTATAVSTTGETEFANPYTLGAIEGTPNLYIYQDGVKITSWYPAGHFDILLKVKETGVVIDSRAVTVTGRNWTDYFTTFKITLTTAGQNPVPLGNENDLDNQSTEADIEDYTDGTLATVAIDYAFSSPFSYDIGDGNGAQSYEVQVDCNSQPLSIVYEVLKFWCREGSTKQLETGADAATLNGEIYRYAVDTYAEKVASPLGTFAGGKMFGARSIYFTNLHGDDAQNFQLIDKGGTTRNPPNFQSFQIINVVSGDRCAVWPEASGDVNKDQYSIKATQNSGVGYVDIGVAIPSDTPSAGTLVVVDSITGAEEILAYASFSGDRFTLSGTTANAYQTADKVHVAYIYEEATGSSVSEAVTYVSDRAVIARVRKKGIVPWESIGTFGATGYTGAASRQADGIVT